MTILRLTQLVNLYRSKKRIRESKRRYTRHLHREFYEYPIRRSIVKLRRDRSQLQIFQRQNYWNNEGQYACELKPGQNRSRL